MITALLLSTITRTLSVYGDEYVGRTMANGQKFYHHLNICATNDWPLGTKLKITFKGKTITVTVADRMHKRFNGKRIDLPRTPWRKLEAKPDGLHKGATVEALK